MLMLTAGEDVWVDTTKTTAFCDNLKNCTLEATEGTYHELFNEIERARYVKRAVGFLNTALP